jgi:hypothetical protein
MLLNIMNINGILEYMVINLKVLLGNCSERAQSWDSVKPMLIGMWSYFVGEEWVGK